MTNLIILVTSKTHEMLLLGVSILKFLDKSFKCLINYNIFHSTPDCLSVYISNCSAILRALGLSKIVDFDNLHLLSLVERCKWDLLSCFAVEKDLVTVLCLRQTLFCVL